MKTSYTNTDIWNIYKKAHPFKYFMERYAPSINLKMPDFSSYRHAPAFLLGLATTILSELKTSLFCFFYWQKKKNIYINKWPVDVPVKVR